MAVIEIAKIQVRRGQENQSGIPQLDPGEFAWAEDTEHLYIGKRIAEGASTDENTRILTEQDLNFFKLAAQSTGTVSSAYTYRQDEAFIGAVSSTVQEKLDNTVSLTDYGVNASSTASNITYYINDAINKIFKNMASTDWQRTSARRNLIIPAGSYLIDSTVQLPPYTSLVGEGVDLTTLTMITPNVMFETVDSTGTNYPSMSNAPINKSKNISIKGMTLAFDSTVTTTKSFLSLDNVDSALVEKVKFYSNNTGTGIVLRGLIEGDTDVDNCANIHILECKFDGLRTGIEGVDTVTRPVIANNEFDNLVNGIVMHSSTSSLYRSPINGKFIENKFERISNEAIYVGTASHVTNHISEGNFFRHVGNGPSRGIDRGVTSSTSCTSVITFLANGNSSVNDTFNRKVYADSISTTTNFYFNTLVQGNAVVDSTFVSTATILAGATGNVVKSNIVKLPLVSGKDQLVTMRYSLYDGNYSRKGKLTINLTSDGYGSISDYYDYSYLTTVTDPVFNIDSTSTYVSKGYVVLTCNNGLGDTYNFESQSDTLI
jgi:hypothetical protein